MADGLFSSISTAFGKVTEGVAGFTQEARDNPFLGKTIDAINPSLSRLGASGLTKGGGRASTRPNTPSVRFVNETSDWRVKISLAQSADYFYKDKNPGILAPLVKTNGVVFPYTPQISLTHNAKYGATNLTHSNYTNYFYEGSEVQAINISSEFTVQNVNEGAYVLACIQFFRAATKMFFGQGKNVGHPPPMVFLNGYGDYYFPNVSCVITNFTHTMPAEVDYIPVAINGQAYTDDNGTKSTIGGGYARVPTSSTISITLQPIYSRRNLADNFNLEEFAKGSLIKGKGGFI